MLKNYRNHLIIGLIFFAMTLGQQYLFYALKGLSIVPFSFGKYLLLVLFFTLATFIRGFGLRLFFLSLIFLLNYFQMAHLSYFGTQLVPNEIYLLVTQFHEIQGTLNAELHHILLPLTLTLIPFLMGFFLLRKADLHRGSRLLGVLFILYFAYNPIRTYVTGNTWGRQPSTRELGGMNVYLSFSYFLGKILPAKILNESHAQTPNSSLSLKVESTQESSWDKIIFVMGESLGHTHLSLYGYPRDTTPTLMALKSDPSFYFSKSLSSGVSTDISLAFFFNLGFGDAGVKKASTGVDCLFKHGKNQGFETGFFSIQTNEQLRYINPYLCLPSLNHFYGLEAVAPETVDTQAAEDRKLLSFLTKYLRPKAKQFFVLHQRGSHAPWAVRSTARSKKFLTPEGVDSRVDDYDNSVVEFDFFMQELITLLQNQNEKILLVFTSDHGEALGENGSYGHGFLNALTFEVPFMVKSFGQELPLKLSTFPKITTHYSIGLFLLEEMGLSLNQASNSLINDYEIYGNDIDGFAGKAVLKSYYPEGYEAEIKL